MVSRKSAFGRFAFTLIELIFAIVVISIAVITIPVMTKITSDMIEDNLVQEAIFAGSAELMGATSYYWDLNSMQDNAMSHLERVIDINGNCNSNRLKSGHINQPYHRRCLDSNVTGLANLSDVNFPNLNNAVHGNAGIFDNATAQAAGYKNAYTSTVTIDNIDSLGAANNNIKKITVLVKNANGDDITRLSTYSANIGEIDFYKRRF